MILSSRSWRADDDAASEIEAVEGEGLTQSIQLSAWVRIPSCGFPGRSNDVVLRGRVLR